MVLLCLFWQAQYIEDYSPIISDPDHAEASRWRMFLDSWGIELT